MERTSWGARLPLPGAAFTLLLAFLLSNFGIIPAAAPVYRTVWLYLVPLAIPLLLFNADVRRIPRDAGFTLMAFAIGALGTIVGTVVAFYIVPLGKNAWQMAAMFSAAYIGGPMNYAAAAQAVGLRAPGLFAGGQAAIDLMMMVYFLFLFALPVLWRLRFGFNEPASDREGASINLLSMAFALALSAAICVVGFFIEARFGWKGTAILIIAAIAVALAAALPRKMATLQGTNEIGVLLMLVFFATIGASANIGVVFKGRPTLLMFAAVILVVHLAVILAAGKYLKISLAQIIIGSSAGVGDSTSAAAMAAVRRWYQYVPAAILCGTLGYASATFIGVKLGKMLH
jgi:uncharacterized membrane protein